ncbi:MAG: putative transcriptional regulator, TetR family [Ilumatobacteraceae bacterium]|nr:putative transcriptional regulator, TetR family [Ilumatobacteraceae bacterium]
MRQNDRKAETRGRLLAAAADLFAEHGIAGASVDAIAQRAGRTVGALYGHFASKDELLFAVVDEWLGDTATVVAAELELADDADGRLAALWRAVSQPSSARWLALEHEVWSHAIRNPVALERLRTRYAATWEGIGMLPEPWPEFGAARENAPAVVGVLFGMAMMHQVSPGSITDEMAVRTLHHLVVTSAITSVTDQPQSNTPQPNSTGVNP